MLLLISRVVAVCSSAAVAISGVIGLAQFVNSAKGDPNSLMVMGAVMLGGIITGKPAVSLDKLTPIARLTSEYNVFVLPANSPFKTLKDVIEQMKKDPASVKFGGGSRGATEHIAAAMLARAIGVDAAKLNYVPFSGGGEALAAILGGHVVAGISGLSEWSGQIASGELRFTYDVNGLLQVEATLLRTGVIADPKAATPSQEDLPAA